MLNERIQLTLSCDCKNKPQPLTAFDNVIHGRDFEKARRAAVCADKRHDCVSVMHLRDEAGREYGFMRSAEGMSVWPKRGLSAQE